MGWMYCHALSFLIMKIRLFENRKPTQLQDHCFRLVRVTRRTRMKKTHHKKTNGEIYCVWVLLKQSGLGNKHFLNLFYTNTSFIFIQNVFGNTNKQWTDPQLAIIIICYSTWSILIQQIRIILSGDNLTQKTQKKDRFTSLHNIKKSTGLGGACNFAERCIILT